MDVAKLKVAELKRELKVRGLSTVGNKLDLIERLTAAVEGSGDGSLVMDDDGNVEEGLEDEDEDEEDDDDELGEESAILGTPILSGIQSSISTSLSTPTTMDSSISASITPGSDQKSSNFKRGASKDDSKIPSKKIVLNRTNLPAVEKENLDGKDSKDGSASSDDGLVKTVKLAKVELTAKERLELRAKKFGVSLTETTKADVRAARFGLKDSSSKAATVAPALDLLKKRAERFGTSVSSVMEQAEMEERKRRRQERFGISEPVVIAGTKTVVTSTTKTAASESADTTHTDATISRSSVASSKRVPIMAPSGSAPADSTTGDKKKLRAERFKIK